MPEGIPSGEQPTAVPLTTVFEINGERVTLEELQKGYLRQSDYTQKTQDLANQRRIAEKGLNLLAALDQDPKATIQAIAENYKIDLGSRQSAAPETPQLDEWGEPVAQAQPTEDPRVAKLQAELDQLRNQVGSVATSQQQQILTAEIAAAQAKYDDFDVDVTLRHMQANGFRTVEEAYRDLNWTEAQNALSEMRKRQAEEAEIVARKRELQGQVGDVGVPAFNLPTPAPDPATNEMSWEQSLAVAFNQELDERGVSFEEMGALLT